MKTFTIKSKHTLDVLFSVLTRQEFVVTKGENHELVIEVPDEQREDFETVIGCYIGLVYFNQIVEKTLSSMNLSKARKKRILSEAEQYFVTSMYWKGLTTILVSDFFRTRDTLNIESFALFNMKNWSKEIENYIIGFVSIAGGEEEGIEVSFEEVFQTMKATLHQKGVPVADFETIHVHLKEGHLLFIAENGTQLDDAYLTEVLDGQLIIDVAGEAENWEKDMILFPSFCMMFPIQTVIFHRSVPKKVQMEMMDMLRDNTLGHPLTFIVCKGCDTCGS